MMSMLQLYEQIAYMLENIIQQMVSERCKTTTEEAEELERVECCQTTTGEVGCGTQRSAGEATNHNNPADGLRFLGY